MPSSSSSINPVNTLPYVVPNKEPIVEPTVYVEIPNKEAIQKDPAEYIKYLFQCINTIRGDFHSVCEGNLKYISNELGILAKETRENSTKLEELNSKLDVLKTELHRLANDMERNKQEMLQSNVEILKALEATTQQNNDRFDMLSEQIQMLSTQGSQKIQPDSVRQQELNPTIIQRGAYTKQEIDDKTLFSMSVDDLMKLRNNITSTKSRNKPLATGETNGVYEMCVANMDKINKRIQQLRQQ